MPTPCGYAANETILIIHIFIFFALNCTTIAPRSQVRLCKSYIYTKSTRKTHTSYKHYLLHSTRRQAHVQERDALSAELLWAIAKDHSGYLLGENKEFLSRIIYYHHKHRKRLWFHCSCKLLIAHLFLLLKR